MQFNSVLNVLYVPYVTVYNKMNFSHDKNKPLFDQVKYDEQKTVILLKRDTYVCIQQE